MENDLKVWIYGILIQKAAKIFNEIHSENNPIYLVNQNDFELICCNMLIKKRKMGYNKTKMANIKPKWLELDKIFKTILP